MKFTIDYMEQYLNNIRNIGEKSENTIQSYKLAIEQYFDFLNNNNYETNNQSTLAYIGYLKSKYSYNTIKLKNTAIKVYNKYCIQVFNLDVEIYDGDLIKQISKKVKKESKEVVAISEKDLEKLISKVQSQDEKMILLLGSYANLRRKEIAGVLMSDYTTDIKGRKVINVRPEISKGGKGRKVMIPSVLSDELDKLNLKGDEKIVSVGYEAIRKKFDIMLKRSRMGKKGYTPHSMRHYYGTTMYAKGVDILYISKQMGHSSTLVTEKYYVKNIQDKDIDLDSVF